MKHDRLVRTRRLGLLAALLLPVALGLSVVPTSGATFSARTTGTAALGTDTLNPPTGVTATRTCPVATAPAFRSVNGAEVKSSPVTVSAPAGVQAGDVLVAFVLVHDDATTISAPAGWNAIYQIANVAGNLRNARFWRVATSSEPASYSFSWTGNNIGGVASVMAYTGASTTNPIDASEVQANGLATSMSAPSITTSSAPTRLIVGVGGNSKAKVTEPAGTTSRSNSPGLAVADQAVSTAGATGTRTFTTDIAMYSITGAVALRAAPAPSDSVALSWTATSDTYADGYELRRTAPDGSSTTRTIAGRTTTSATDSPPSTSTSYTYALRSAEGSWRSTAVTRTVAAC